MAAPPGVLRRAPCPRGRAHSRARPRSPRAGPGAERCLRVSAPSPAMTTMPSAPADTIVPGTGPGAIGTASATWMRSCAPSSVVSATGRGFNARTRRASAAASSRQSRRASALVSFAAYVASAGSCSTNSARPAASASRASTMAAPPTRARRPSSSPAVSCAPIVVARASMTGPVSSPASMRMMQTPVRLSPARIARATGAAPRQRGSSEAWTLRQPRRGNASTSGGSSRP